MSITEILLASYMLLGFLILVIGAKVKRKGEFHEDFLSLEIGKSLQGYAAIAIMLHHLSQSITQYGAIYKGPINFMSERGIFFTGIFFFFSGYGLYTSFVNKEDYLKTFLRKRLPTVLIPFYVINTIFFVVSLVDGKTMSIPEMLLYVSGLLLLNGNMWYIVEIVFLYLAFYFIFKNVKKQGKAFAVMALFIFVMTTISLLLGHDNRYNAGAWFMGEWWYNTTWVFFVGMLVAKSKDNVVEFVKKRYKILLPAGIAVAATTFYISLCIRWNFGYYTEWKGTPGYGDKALTWLGDLGAVTCFVCLLLLITMKVQFNNRVLKFVGGIALELYMIHNIFIIYLKDVITSDVLFILIVYVCGIVAAIGIRYVDRIVIKKLSPTNCLKTK